MLLVVVIVWFFVVVFFLSQVAAVASPQTTPYLPGPNLMGCTALILQPWLPEELRSVFLSQHIERQQTPKGSSPLLRLSGCLKIYFASLSSLEGFLAKWSPLCAAFLFPQKKGTVGVRRPPCCHAFRGVLQKWTPTPS